MRREKWIKRTQVSEHDPIVQRERLRKQKTVRNHIFGDASSRLYLRSKEVIRNSSRKIESLQAELSLEVNDTRKANLENSINYHRENIEIESYNEINLKQDFIGLLTQMLILINKGDVWDNRKKFVEDQMTSMLSPFLNGSKFILDENVIIRFYEAINKDKINADRLVAIVQEHKRMVETQEKKLREFAVTVRGEFVEKIKNAVQAGELPNHIIDSLERLDSINFDVVDVMQDILSENMGHVNDAGNIRISNQRIVEGDWEGIRKSLFHEFMHEISGKSITVSSREDVDDFHSVLYRKSGIRLNRLSGARFTWLNEAITEWLALRYSGQLTAEIESEDGHSYRGSKSYVKERKLLDKLIESGLSEDIIIGAYFENFTEDKSVQEGKGQYFATLVKTINEKMGEFEFNRLDNEFFLDEVRGDLGNHFLVEGDILAREDAQKLLESENYEVYYLDASVGPDNASKATKRLSFLVRDVDLGDKSISKKEFLDKLNRDLQSLKEKNKRNLSFILKPATN